MRNFAKASTICWVAFILMGSNYCINKQRWRWWPNAHDHCNVIIRKSIRQLNNDWTYDHSIILIYIYIFHSISGAHSCHIRSSSIFICIKSNMVKHNSYRFNNVNIIHDWQHLDKRTKGACWSGMNEWIDRRDYNNYKMKLAQIAQA